MSTSPLSAKIDDNPGNDNNDAVHLPQGTVLGASAVSTAEKLRQGHTGDGLRYILVFSLAGSAALLAIVVMIFAR